MRLTDMRLLLRLMVTPVLLVVVAEVLKLRLDLMNLLLLLVHLLIVAGRHASPSALDSVLAHWDRLILLDPPCPLLTASARLRGAQKAAHGQQSRARTPGNARRL